MGLTALDQKATRAYPLAANITQRLVRYHERRLTAPETREYIAHHLKVAGCTSPLLTPEAIEEIFQLPAASPGGLTTCAPIPCSLPSSTRRNVVDQKIRITVIQDLNGNWNPTRHAAPTPLGSLLRAPEELF